MVHEVTSKEDFEKSLEVDPLVVVDFYADWCGPCVRFAPHFDELATELTSVVFLKVNVDKLPELSQKYSVTSIPAFKMFKGKQLVGQFVGSNKEGLKEAVLSLDK